MKTPITHLIIVIFCLSGTQSGAAHNPSVTGARQVSMSSSGVTSSDLWSVCNNQAGLGFITNPSAGFFVENRFLIQSLSLKAAALAMPIPGGTLGVSVSHFGYSAYNETYGGIGFGKAFGHKFAAGFRTTYCLTRIADGYGNASAVTVEGGIISVLTEKLTLGAHVYNPVTIRMAQQGEALIPLVFKAGCHLRVSDKLSAVAEVIKTTSQKPDIQTGFEYQAAPRFFIRGGISTQTVVLSLGAGMTWKCLVFDFSSAYHQILGYSPQLSVSYEFCK